MALPRARIVGKQRASPTSASRLSAIVPMSRRPSRARLPTVSCRARTSPSMLAVSLLRSSATQTESTPQLIVIESRSTPEAFLAQLDRLAEVCDPGTKVMAIGHTNDVLFLS